MNKYEKKSRRNDPEIIFYDFRVKKYTVNGIVDNKSKDYIECLKLHKGQRRVNIK